MTARLPAAVAPPDPAERDPLLPDLPYRPNVGICLFNAEGLVFAGRAYANPFGWPDPEIFAEGADWALPQGGIDANEDIVTAARRELWEETGVTSAALIAVTQEWWSYDFPVRGARIHKLHPFRGQRQRWVAFRFTGEESEITVAATHTEEPPEFLEWRWRPLAELPSVAPLHRRQQYARVVSAFEDVGPA
ncbi:putative (di)nucleoside polyphosphate hydrolase [Pleomorphomonas diazotrophica]|uniref:RNA pyrophosphohydrolase n=1 Tax=Pleomorphomonas diazotrophica TaxID=1166257 RepID=UPI0008F35622|nr:RNA pyrophosphohydrolase [Pleomorphomonas diazotrophica]SFM69686.1 putative (di)nucleoside polyphosphate hydrolase [Pleomorphomonas diazotrophica]